MRILKACRRLRVNFTPTSRRHYRYGLKEVTQLLRFLTNVIVSSSQKLSQPLAKLLLKSFCFDASNNPSGSESTSFLRVSIQNIIRDFSWKLKGLQTFSPSRRWRFKVIFANIIILHDVMRNKPVLTKLSFATVNIF